MSHNIMLYEKINQVIKEAYPALESLQDDYFIIGSAALILSGVEVGHTSDIDILTSDRDANYLKKVWKEKHVKEYQPKQNDLFRSNFSRYNFEFLDVEIMGDLAVRKNNDWKPLIIQDYTYFSRDEIRIKLPTMEEQKRILKWFGRD
ncbi:hypothetical protein LJC52_03315, partial [Bacteroidales bacterium OttesenSCG-928-A17]|nr:hypothetical protein [Bacteroidales bacterium OttesenSCG-928-A17]